MASVRQNTTGGRSTFKNIALRKLSGRGYDYKDSVITNSEAIGTLEDEIGWKDNNDLLRYGYDNNNVDQLYDFAYSDVYSKKNIPFFNQEYPEKLEQLQKYSLQDEIEMILDTLSDEIIVYNSDDYFANIKWNEDVNLKKEAITEINESLEENFERIYNMFGFKNENTAWHYVKKFLIEGFLSFEIIWDKSNKNIIGFKEINPITLTPKIYKDGTRGWVQFPDDPVKRVELSDAQVVFISFSSINGEGRISYTERLIRSFNLLRIMEQSRIIWATVNSSYKTKFIIPVGGKSKTMAKQTLNSLMRSYRENVDFDVESGEMKVNGKAMMPFSKEYWIPEGENGTPQIENVGNDGPDLSDTESLKYFVDKLIQVSKIPKNRFTRFDDDNSPTWESSAEGYTREEIYFDRFKSRLQGKLAEMLVKPTILQTKRDLPYLDNDIKFEANVSLDWQGYDIFTELKEIELTQRKIDLIQSAKDAMIDYDSEGNEEKFFSSEFLVKKHAPYSSKDLKMNAIMKQREKDFAAQEKASEEGYDDY